MSLWFLIALACGWLSAGALAHALVFARLQRERPVWAETDYWHHLAVSLPLGLLGGLVGLPVALMATGARHGLKFW